MGSILSVLAGSKPYTTSDTCRKLRHFPWSRVARMPLTVAQWPTSERGARALDDHTTWGMAMAGFTRRAFVVLGIALLALLVAPTVAAVAADAEQYPPSVSPATATKSGQGSEYDPGHALAFTGSSDTIPMVWIAAGLVVFGGALVFVARQRRSAPTRT